MNALYSLHNRIAGFDFFPWLIMQKMAGAAKIIVDDTTPNYKKWPLENVVKRIESIIKPGPALLGLPCEVGTVGDPNLAPYAQRHLVQMVKDGMVIPRLKTVLPPASERYTVTLRKTQRSPTRNSEESVWREFAAEIGARVIPDYDDEPIHLHERMALYAGAEMNFFVTNGPVILCFLSEYPAMSFDCQQQENVHRKMGIAVGEKYPFCLPQHQQIYEAPTPETIRRHFRVWRDAQ